MGEPDDPSLVQTVKSKTAVFGFRRSPATHQDSVLPTHNDPQATKPQIQNNPLPVAFESLAEKSRNNNVTSHNVTGARHSPNDPANTGTDANGTTSSVEHVPLPIRMKNGTLRFLKHTKNALLYSWVNVLLVFVPIGIAVHLAGLGPEIVFAMNAVAIIPLAGLLAHATEAVAARLGDTLGALLNVSFGNAVELILFIILLADDQIRVVQAALLGSILANLLLILGMAFLLGGLRYQEQVYNSTVTQTSACMLSLAVMSLLLPTAFHASFSDYTTADEKTLHVSRGTSVVLLLIYVLYLLFQLKSHSYLYASTPQHIIDEESAPGILNDIFNSSSSSESSSDSSSSDSDSSLDSHTTVKRIKKAFRNRRRRKSSVSSKDSPFVPSVSGSPSVEQQHPESRKNISSGDNGSGEVAAERRGSALNAAMSGDEVDVEHAPAIRDFEAGSSASLPHPKHQKKHKHKGKSRRNDKKKLKETEVGVSPVQGHVRNTTQVAFADEVQQGDAAPTTKRQFRPPLPSLLSHNVFSNPQTPNPAGIPGLSNLRMAGPRNASLRRTISLPDRMNGVSTHGTHSAHSDLLNQIPNAAPSVSAGVVEEHVPEMSRTAAIVLLIISTALVALCADFLSEAIEPMVKKTGVSEAFIGLIILPIVGNAAEHVTAVLVATKNKMDLAIGVAVGSSIQIAIFITPFIVILGWIMHKDMSLYFNIFETVALFVTVLIANFLVLDGRSNYMEGSLLIAAYVIIALSSFFYPDGCEASAIGGQTGNC